MEVLNEVDKIYLFVFVVVELLFGFKNGIREVWNWDILKKFEFKSIVEWYFFIDEIIEIFSDVFLFLKKVGNLIFIYDIWIVVIVIEMGSVIVIYDKYFL